MQSANDKNTKGSFGSSCTLGQICHLIKIRRIPRESLAFPPNLKGIKIDQMEEFSFLGNHGFHPKTPTKHRNPIQESPKARTKRTLKK